MMTVEEMRAEIKRLRKEVLRMSQRELGALIGWDRTAMSRIETGARGQKFPRTVERLLFAVDAVANGRRKQRVKR